MSDELDEQLAVVFSEARESFPSGEFVAAFLVRTQRVRRIRATRRVAMVLAVVIAGAYFMPAVLEQTAAMMGAIAEYAQSYAPLIVSPWGWSVSMLVGLTVVLRAGSRRRG